MTEQEERVEPIAEADGANLILKYQEKEKTIIEGLKAKDKEQQQQPEQVTKDSEKGTSLVDAYGIKPKPVRLEFDHFAFKVGKLDLPDHVLAHISTTLCQLNELITHALSENSGSLETEYFSCAGWQPVATIYTNMVHSMIQSLEQLIKATKRNRAQYPWKE